MRPQPGYRRCLSERSGFLYIEASGTGPSSEDLAAMATVTGVI
jgi:hypothetical protein